MARLGDVCVINPKAPPIKDTQLVSFVPMPKVGEEGEFDPSATRPYAEVKKGFTYFAEGDVLFAKITPCMENGKGAVAHNLRNGIGYGSTEFHVLRPKSGLILGEWLYYLTAWPAFRKEAERNMTGSAGQKRVPKDFLENYRLTVPSIHDQQQHVQTLNKLCALISLRKQQIAKLDELVKARFVEMFGDIDPALYMSMAELCSIITDGTHQPPKFVENGIPFLFVSNITGNVLTYDAEKFIDEHTYSELIKRTPIEIGDILLSTVGSYGHPAVVKEATRFCFQRHIAYLKPRHDIIDCNYLHGAILSSIVQEQIEAKVKGIAQKTLNLSEIRAIRLPVPCMEEQRQFAAFVGQTDQQKLTIQHSLDKLELLKKALMQKYFG